MDYPVMTPEDIYFNMSRGSSRGQTSVELTNPIVPKNQKAQTQQDITQPTKPTLANLPILGLLFLVGLLIGFKYIFEKSA